MSRCRCNCMYCEEQRKEEVDVMWIDRPIEAWKGVAWCAFISGMVAGMWLEHLLSKMP